VHAGAMVTRTTAPGTTPSSYVVMKEDGCLLFQRSIPAYKVCGIAHLLHCS
jgi:hypothetical protein